MRRTTGNEDDAVPQRRTRPTRWHDTRSRATVTMATLAPVALVARPTRAYAQPAVCCKIRPYPVGFHASDLRFYPGVLITPQRDRNCATPSAMKEGRPVLITPQRDRNAAGTTGSPTPPASSSLLRGIATSAPNRRTSRRFSSSSLLRGIATRWRGPARGRPRTGPHHSSEGSQRGPADATAR